MVTIPGPKLEETPETNQMQVVNHLKKKYVNLNPFDEEFLL